jgi:hypothetical protein
MRFLLVLVMIVGATEIAGADNKKTAPKPTTSGKQNIEIKDFSFDIENARRVNTNRGGPSPVGNLGRSGNKH